MPPSTPAPALSGFETDVSPVSQQDLDEAAFALDATTGVRVVQRDTDRVTAPMFDTDPSGAPEEGDGEVAKAVAEQVRALTNGALGYPKPPLLDDLGEPDVFLEAFVQGGGEMCLNAGRVKEISTIPDVMPDSQISGGFEINLVDHPDFSDDEQ